MKLEELQTRLTHLLIALSNEDSRIIQGFTKAFIEDFTPNQTWVISLTEIEGYDKPLIEYTTWDEEKDGPIPGKENPFIALEAYLREPKPEILVYYNTDEEYFTFNRLQDEPMADTSMADDTFTYEEATFYIFKD